MRVLIVEDERRLARTLADLMEAHNYTVDLSYDCLLYTSDAADD